MPKVRKRKLPIVTVESASNKSSTPLSSRTTIRQFHVLLKRRAQLKASVDSDESVKSLAVIEDEIRQLGGLETYQRMSAIGQGTDRGGGSEKILVGWLKDFRFHKKSSCKLRLLEVGALKPDNYSLCRTWIDHVPMDLRSRHPSIIEQDFLQLDVAEHRNKWDIISLSLVLNFVPEPKDRGRMLSIAHDILTSKGHLFLALPFACVNNSRYLDLPRLKSLLAAIGFTEVKGKWNAGGRMAYWLYQKAEPSGLPPEIFAKKSVLRQGNRNNFCILL